MDRMKQVFRTVFPSKTEFPCEQVVEFSPGGGWLNLTLAENRGIETHLNGSSRIIGNVRIPASGEKVAVTFALNENRMLEISVNGQLQPILGIIEDK
jgi:hypothetical protein